MSNGAVIDAGLDDSLRRSSRDDIFRSDSVNSRAESVDDVDGDGEDFFKMSAAEWQHRTLQPLKEDLAIWISDLLGVEITSEDFFDRLSSGVILCNLAKHIHEQAVLWKGESQITPFRGMVNARSGPFFARENLTNFLKWCRACKINETCLFESEDLVLQRNLKNVIVCLYALARKCRNLHMALPSLVNLENELEELMRKAFHPTAHDLSSDFGGSEHSFGGGSMTSNDESFPHNGSITSNDESFSRNRSMTSNDESFSRNRSMTSNDESFPTLLVDESDSLISTEDTSSITSGYSLDASESSGARTPRSTRSRIPTLAKKKLSLDVTSMRHAASCDVLSPVDENTSPMPAGGARNRKSSIPRLARRDLRAARSPSRESLTPSRASPIPTQRPGSRSRLPGPSAGGRRSRSVDISRKMSASPLQHSVEIDLEDRTRGRDKRPKHPTCQPTCQKRCCLKQDERNVIKRKEYDGPILDLDEEIRRIVAKCRCEEWVTVRKLAVGTYLINERRVYIRILNGRHVMVRVGGGWQTLEEYLLRHGDVTRMAAFARDGSAMLDKDRPTNDRGYLVPLTTQR